MRRYWTCSCGTRNERVGGRKKCFACGRAAPKVRVPKHAVTLRDTSYQEYADLSVLIHGGEHDACGCCGRPKGSMRHHRDHDHRTGNARGLACFQCNTEVLRGLTLESARLAVAYLERAEAHYGELVA